MLKIKTWIRHNQGVTAAIVLCALLLLMFLGCQSKTDSLITPNAKITLPELQIEYNDELSRLQRELKSLEERTDLRWSDLQKQEEFKQALFNHAMTLVSGGTLNPIGIATTLGSILGIGAIIDNRRKDIRIKTLKKETS